MQSVPDPFLVSDAVTFAVAVAIAFLLAIVPLLAQRRTSARRYVAAGAVGYAAVMLAVWAIPRLFTPGLVCSLPANLVSCLPLAAVGAVVFFAHALAALYAFVRYDLIAPLLGASGATALFCYLCLQLGGEIESLVLVVALGVVAVSGLAVLAGVEYAGRRLLARS